MELRLTKAGRRQVIHTAHNEQQRTGCVVPSSTQSTLSQHSVVLCSRSSTTILRSPDTSTCPSHPSRERRGQHWARGDSSDRKVSGSRKEIGIALITASSAMSGPRARLDNHESHLTVRRKLSRRYRSAKV